MGLGGIQPKAEGFKLEMEMHSSCKTLEFQRRSGYLYLTTRLSRLVLANTGSLLKTEKLGKRLTVFLSISEQMCIRDRGSIRQRHEP